MELSEANTKRKNTALDQLYGVMKTLDDAKGNLFNITASVESDEQMEWWLDRCQEVIHAKVAVHYLIDNLSEADSNAG